MLVTPELVIVGVVVPLTLIPVPAVRDCTPVADTVKLVVPLPETLIPVPPVTVGAVTVTAPVAAETLTPDPARLVTPVLLTVRDVVPDTDIPVPADTVFTPVAETVRLVVPPPAMEIPVPPEIVGPVTVTFPVEEDTETPDPARERTPVLSTVKAVVPDTEIPVPANTSLPAPPPEPVPRGPLILLALVPVTDGLSLGPSILLAGGSPSLQT
jgi:hypothetical protein